MAEFLFEMNSAFPGTPVRGREFWMVLIEIPVSAPCAAPE
jgi:hypothetical protein